MWSRRRLMLIGGVALAALFAVVVLSWRGSESPSAQDRDLAAMPLPTESPSALSGQPNSVSRPPRRPVAAGPAWEVRAPLPSPRESLGLAASGGRVYAVGGFDDRVRDATAAVDSFDPASNTWATHAPMPTARYASGVASGADGRIFAVGGVTGFGRQSRLLDTAEVFDPRTDGWRTLSPLSSARGGVALIAAPDGLIYAIGGYEDNRHVATVEAYDPTTDSWQARAAMPTARYGAGVALIEGRIYVVGGNGEEGVSLSAVEVYDPPSDRWTKRADLPVPRNNLAAAALGDRFYVFGGGLGNRIVGLSVGSTAEYDPRADSWTTRTPAPSTRVNAGAVALGAHIYLVGGGGLANDRDVQAYNPAADPVWPCAPMPTPRAGLAAASVDGLVHAIGGAVVSARGRDYEVSNLNEAFDIATDSWMKRAPMPTPRYFHQVVALHGRLYAIGGVDRSGTLTVVEVYDPASDQWIARAPLPTPRANFALVTGSDDLLYAIGGESVDGDNKRADLATVEAYDPVANRWSRRASLPEPRSGLRAAMGRNGRIYVVGGGDFHEPTTPTYEYDPRADTWRQRAPLLDQRDAPAVTALSDGPIAAFGGSTSIPWADVQIYDPATDVWVTAARMPTERNAAAVAAVEGRVVVLGLSQTGPDTIEIYNASANRWETCGP